MMARRLTALGLAFLLLSGCTMAEPPQPTASETVSNPPESTEPVQRAEFALASDSTATLDPLSGSNSTNLALAGLVYQGLFELDHSFQPQPLLCASYSADESRTVWYFAVRTDITFSDGTPLTASHVAASLNKARTSPVYAARLAQVISVVAADDTVTITLATPNGAFPALLDIPVTYTPETEAAEGGGVEESAGPPAPLGTGLYYYDRTEDGLILRENPNRWQKGSLPLSSIPLKDVVTADARIAAFDTALISAVTADPTAANALGYSGSYEIRSCPTTSMLYLGFNHTGSYCQDAALRQAISRSIDRSVITSVLLAGHADPAVLPVSPASPLYDATLADQLDYSLALAEQLLSDAGYATDPETGLLTLGVNAVELELLVNSENSFRVEIANYLAGELSKLGLTVTVRPLAWESFLAALAIGDFDLYLAQVKMTADFDPTALLTGTLNYSLPIDGKTGLLEDAETQSLLTAFQAAAGEDRAAAMSALHARLATLLPFTPLCFTQTSVYTQWGMVSGLSPTQQNPFYQFHTWTIR